MRAIVREHFAAEIRKAQTAIETENFEMAWTALQRAHILGQAYLWPHVLAHWGMLKLAWRQRDTKEIAGQFVSTICAAPLTLLFGRKRSLRAGRVNTDSSQRMPVPEDLLQILDQ